MEGNPVGTEPSQPGHPTVQAAIEAFGDSLVAKSPRTALNYRSALRRFVDFLEETGYDRDKVLTVQLPDDVLERFYTWLLREYGWERRPTAVAYLAAVRSFFRFLDRRRWLHPEVSYQRIRDALREMVGKVPYKTPRVDDTVAQAVIYVKSCPIPLGAARQVALTLLRDKAILTTLYATGLRRQELSRLDRSDLQDGRARQGLVTGKGNKERVVFFDDESLHFIRAYLEARADGYRPLFLRHDDGRGAPGRWGESWRLSPQSVWGVVRRYGKLAGVNVTTHQLRHLKATVMLNQGAKLSEVQDILGHASPDTTKRIYAHYETSHLRQAFDRYSLPVEEVVSRAGRRSPTGVSEKDL